MVALLSDSAVSEVMDALRPNSSNREKRNAIFELEESAGNVPDEIELYRAIKASGARKHIDIAKAVHMAFLARAG